MLGESPPSTAIASGASTSKTHVGQGSIVTLVDNTVLDKFEKGSKTLIDAIAANDTKFNEIKTLIETVEENNDQYIQLKQKINKFLETDNPLSDHVKSVLTELAGIVGEIANTHPILKLVWLAVAAVYKAAKAMKEFDDKLLQLIEAFRKGKLFTDASLEGSRVAIGDANQKLLKDALETYIKCLNDLIAVALDCYQRPKPDKKKQGIFQMKPNLQWNPSFLSNTSAKLDSILSRLREAKTDLSQAQGAATFNAVSSFAAQQAARQATNYTLEQLDLLKNLLKPVDFVSFEKKKVTGRTWFVDLAEKWLKGQGQVFWFSGPAGCGKSRMAETAFDLFENVEKENQEETMKHDAVFFAFNHKDRNDPKTCIETLAYSVAEKYNTDADFGITKAIFKKCEMWSKEPKKKPQKLEGLIHDLLVMPLKGKKKNVVVVIDALDECEPNSLKEFLTILDSHGMRQFRFFVTSRDPVKLSNAEEHSFDPMFQGNLDDLTAYVQGRLALVTVLSKFQVTDHTKDMVGASEGIFLNASIALDILGTDYSQYKIFETEWNLLMEKKLTSDSLYDVVWSKVAGNATARKLVGIMLSMKRPLKLNGLLTLMDMDADLLQTTIMHIVPLLKGVPNSDSDTVQFKHRTTVEFFVKRVPLQHDLLAVKFMDIIGELLGSLHYLDYSKAVKSFASGTNKFNFGLKSDATLYFIENWTDMLDTSTHFPEVEQFLVEFGDLLLAACIKVRNESLFMELVELGASIEDLVDSNFFNSPVLYESAKLGLAAVCDCLLESGVNVDCTGYTPLENPKMGEMGRKPLHIAVLFNHLETVKVLVEQNADTRSTDSFGCTPFEYSSGTIRKLFQSLFVKKQEELEKIAVMYMTPLQKAIYHRNFELFNELYTESAMLEPNPLNLNTGFHYFAMYYDSKMLGYVSKLSSFEACMSLPNSHGETPFFLAAEKGNKQSVEFLLDRGAQIECPNKNEDTPLATAAYQGKYETVKFLLDRGAQLESQNKKGNTPLVFAALNGHKDTVKLLLDCGANIESQNKDGSTPLAIAAMQGHRETVELLLYHGAKIESQNKDGSTPMAIAAMQGHRETVELLLYHGAKLESQDNTGDTPLTLAANGHKDTVELLLDCDANIESQNKDGSTPLAIAAMQGHRETVELLLYRGANIESQNKKGNTPLTLAASNGHRETVELLLYCGANIKLQNKEGNTPLTLAASNGHKYIVELLLYCGSNIEVQNREGFTPLALAAFNGHMETVETLLHQGANIEAQLNNGYTPLVIATFRGHKETVKFLLELGANIEAKCKNGHTPLTYAAMQGHRETVELLLDHKANIASQTDDSQTPLAIAAMQGHKETVEFLLDQGANIESQDINGETSFALAACRGQNDIVEFLFERGAKIDLQNKNGETPLTLAASKGHKETVQLLQKCGTNIELKDKNGCTFLSRAALNGHTETVELLLDCGASIECKDNKGMTPLALAVQNEHKETAELMRKRGALEPTLFQTIRSLLGFF